MLDDALFTLGTCKIRNTEYWVTKGCDRYPSYPDRLMGTFCGYRFIDKDGKDITTYRKNPSLILISDKCEIRKGT